jgi:hypothetical protein
LQVTGPLLEVEPEELALVLLLEAGALEAADVEPLLELPFAAAVAALSMPPWPLHAPRPPWAAVLPSLQVTGVLAVLELLESVLCATVSAGTASSAPAIAAAHVKPLSRVKIMNRSPLL